MLEYCKSNLKELAVDVPPGSQSLGALPRQLYNRIVNEQQADGTLTGNYGPIYVGSCNLIMLQLDKGFLPTYQR